MLPDDDATTAAAARAAFADARLTFWYDQDRVAADEFAAFTGVRVPAWDIYAVYGGDAVWRPNAAPSQPAIWMHQLPEQTGMRPEDRLDAHRFAQGWLRLIGADAADSGELGLRLHAGGLDASK
jgi:hypothetical protein